MRTNRRSSSQCPRRAELYAAGTELLILDCRLLIEHPAKQLIAANQQSAFINQPFHPTINNQQSSIINQQFP
jgi:hypothetical protein